MADYNRDRPHQIHVHPQPGSGITTTRLGHHQDGNGPSASQVVAVATLLPVSGTLLGLAGLTLVGTLIGLAVVAPLFVIFSPVLVPAFLATVLAVAAFLASGAFGMTGICSLSRALDCIRGELPEAKRKAAEVAAYAGEKTEEAGRTIQQKAQESGGRA